MNELLYFIPEPVISYHDVLKISTDLF